MPDLTKTLKVTEFQEKVYRTVSLIPEGMVTTYKILGEQIGCNSAQAIGQALKKNPYAPEVPCHRVISSNLKIGGYFGMTEGFKISEKIELLKSEGVKFNKDNALFSEQQIYKFS